MTYSENFKKILLTNLIIVVSIVLLDQISKRFLFNEVGLNHTKEFIPGLFNFTIVQNTGGAFSILKQHPICFKIIGVVNVLIFSYLTFCPTVAFNILTKFGCACILGGTIGNLIDRFIYGGVIDFLDLQLFNFAVFNLSDVFIDLGVVLILLGWFFTNKKH
ncbi:MAG: signal peptidase II [Candidatus Melainabacteria bacterium]|nr:signal peptidase II [Candidatus Melainabacteria bacterium]